MPKRPLKRKAPPEHKRYCWCTPHCGKKLTRQARRLHYKNLSTTSQRRQIPDSETCSESDGNSTSESARGLPTSSTQVSYQIQAQAEESLVHQGDDEQEGEFEEESANHNFQELCANRDFDDVNANWDFEEDSANEDFEEDSVNRNFDEDTTVTCTQGGNEENINSENRDFEEDSANRGIEDDSDNGDFEEDSANEGIEENRSNRVFEEDSANGEFEEYSDNAKSQPGPETPDDITSESEQEDLYGSECDSEFDEWKEFDETNESAALTDEDMLQELEEILSDENYAELWESRLYFFFPFLNFNNMEYLGSNVLSDEDLDNILAFKLRMVSNMPRKAFDQMRFAFKHKLNIHSLYVITHRIAILSGIEPQWYDCCVNSCIAYTGDYAELDECPDCSESRRNIRNEPRRLFCYIPLIPRLQDFFANEKSLNELLYRFLYSLNGGSISDVFDSEHYRNLRKTRVTVDGRKLPHRYFEGKHDIAFSTCLDSYLLYKRRRGGPSACPILVQIYNLPPEIRTHISRLICLGVIPGPRPPKRPATFYHPLEEESVLLAKGVKTFDCVEQKFFDLHAYNIFPLGDIVALEKVLNIKGHNGKCPCRSCEIKAIYNPNSPNKTYYVPLTHPGKIRVWKATELPLRTHASWADVTAKISEARLEKDRKALAMHHGIKGMPALQRVGSIDYARGVPWDYMHLLLENVVKNLVHLWMGKFKGLDDGIEDYIIPDHIWKEIGNETVAAIKDIPSAFVRSLGNIFEDKSNYTAEGWAFWFTHIAPILLRNRFQKEKYYKHFHNLVDIMKTCTQFTLTYEEIDDLENKIIKWVEEYER